MQSETHVHAIINTYYNRDEKFFQTQHPRLLHVFGVDVSVEHNKQLAHFKPAVQRSPVQGGIHADWQTEIQ